MAKVNRKPTNVSLDPGLVAQAREHGVNVSRACESGLVLELKRVREARWLAENRDKLLAWNDWLAENGMPGEDVRAWG